jgi:hypothetical protein
MADGTERLITLLITLIVVNNEGLICCAEAALAM